MTTTLKEEKANGSQVAKERAGSFEEFANTAASGLNDGQKNDSVSLISHGAGDGQIAFSGNSEDGYNLGSKDSMTSDSAKAAMSKLRDSMAPNSEIILAGCNTAGTNGIAQSLANAGASKNVRVIAAKTTIDLSSIDYMPHGLTQSNSTWQVFTGK